MDTGKVRFGHIEFSRRPVVLLELTGHRPSCELEMTGCPGNHLPGQAERAVHPVTKLICKGAVIKHVILLIGLLAQPGLCANTAYNPVFITDAKILNTLKNYARAGQDPFSGKDVEICKSLGGGESLVIIVNGTEVARLTPAQTSDVLGRHPGIFTATSKKANVGKRTGLLAKHFSSIDKVKAMGRWDTGIWVAPGFSNDFTGAAVQSAFVDVDYSGRFSFVYTGGGVSYKQYTRGILSDAVTEVNPNWSGATQNYSARFHVGVPWIKYELDYSGNNLPEYYWLQEDLDKKYFNSDDGNLILKYVAGTSKYTSVSQLDRDLQYKLTDKNNRLASALASNPDTSAALRAIAAERQRSAEGAMVNLFSPDASMDPISHKLTLKMGMLHYQFIYSGSYTTPIHRVYIDGVELFIGKWGMGIISTTTDDNKTSFFPGVWLDAYQISLPFLGLGPVEWSPLRIDYFQMRRNFVTGARTVFHFNTGN